MEPKVFRNLLQQLPLFIQDQVFKYKKWQDRQRCVIGKNLLLTGLCSLEHISCTLSNLKYTTFRRPYFDSPVDFNISHSGDFTICAINETTRIGIDLEKIQSFDFNHIANQFSTSERRQLSQSKNSLHTFYKLWTQKEAFLKAVGTGLQVPLSKITIENNKVALDGQEWFLHEMNLHEEYVCHLCTSASSPIIAIREVQFPTNINCNGEMQ